MPAALGPRPLIQLTGSPGQIRLLVATHPHFDHIGGMFELFDNYNGLHPRHAGGSAETSADPSAPDEVDTSTPYASTGWIDQFWEPGYFFPGPTYHNLMRQLEDGRVCRRRLQPTSGTSMYLDAVKLTVIGPGVSLRSRFDTYGVGVNDASITLMIEYPAVTIYGEPDPTNAERTNRRAVPAGGHRLLLGADAQFLSWAQAAVDFPDLEQQQNPVLAKELRTARGRDFLAADVFKLSHHASKHGINVELLERVSAEQTLISATAGSGRYHFPHLLAMEAAREARQATTSSNAARADTDHALGIGIVTSGAVLDDQVKTAWGPWSCWCHPSPAAACASSG